jgi:hypothetical protein
MGFGVLLKKTRWIVLGMLVVYLGGTAAGYAAARRGWTDAARLRTTRIGELSRNLEYKVPIYGAILRKYKEWERPRLMSALFKGRATQATFLILFNNWVVADFTMVVRTVTLLPLLLYPYGRFAQGAALAKAPAGFQVGSVWLTEFGGYFVTICAALCLVLWTLAYRRFGFPSRRKALGGGLKIFAAAYLLSGVFFLTGAWLETMLLLGRTFG